MKTIRIDSNNRITLDGKWDIAPFSLKDMGVDPKTGKGQISIGFRGSDFPGGVLIDGVIHPDTCVEVNNHPYEGKHFNITGPTGALFIDYNCDPGEDDG